MRRRLCEADLYDRITVKKPLLKKQNHLKSLQWAKTHKDWAVEQWNNSFGLTNQSSKSLGQIGGSMCGEELVKELQPPVSSTLKNGGGVGSVANCRVWDLKGKLNQTSYHRILKHHSIPSKTRLVGQGFILMQDNYPEHNSKLYQR